MDLTKFLSACTFMYLQDKVNEKHVALAQKEDLRPSKLTDVLVHFFLHTVPYLLDGPAIAVAFPCPPLARPTHGLAACPAACPPTGLDRR